MTAARQSCRVVCITRKAALNLSGRSPRAMDTMDIPTSVPPESPDSARRTSSGTSPVSQCIARLAATNGSRPASATVRAGTRRSSRAPRTDPIAIARISVVAAEPSAASPRRPNRTSGSSTTGWIPRISSPTEPSQSVDATPAGASGRGSSEAPAVLTGPTLARDGHAARGAPGETSGRTRPWRGVPARSFRR